MKKLVFKIICLLALVMIMFSVSATVWADANDYTLLIPLPVPGITNNAPTPLGTYLPAAFNLMIAAAAVMSFVMITWGGITYATSDALSAKSQGKEYITNAIYGLLLVIGAYVILWTINPNILNFNILLTTPSSTTVNSVTTDSTNPTPTLPPGCTYTSSTASSGQAANGGTLPGYCLSASEVAQNTQMVKALMDNHVMVNNGGAPCSTGLTSGCTNIVGEPQSAIIGVEKLAGSGGCNCTVLITGGTEGGHKAHGPGKPVMDLSLDSTLDGFITSNGGAPVSTSLGPQYTVNKNGISGTFLKETSGGVHWHVVFQ